MLLDRELRNRGGKSGNCAACSNRHPCTAYSPNELIDDGCLKHEITGGEINC
jgi:hypothetical protein